MGGGAQQIIRVVTGDRNSTSHPQRGDRSPQEVSSFGTTLHEKHMKGRAVMGNHQARKTGTAAQIDDVPGIRGDTRDVLPSVGQFYFDIGWPDDADALCLAQDLDQVVIRHPPA